MPIEVRLEQSSMGMQEGTVLEWFKQPGDDVEEGEILGEVETAKSVLEITAPAAGKIASILVDVGEEVPPRTLLVQIATEGEDVDEVRSKAAEAAVNAPEPAPAASQPRPQTANVTRTEVQVAPAARRLAKESGVGLERVRGTGPAGRITEDDVRRTLVEGEHIAAGALELAKAIPLEGMRGEVAERMHASLQRAAQFTLSARADVTELERMRDEFRKTLPVTYTHLVIRAAAFALREHPRLNAVVSEGAIQELSSINIGIAVALDEGLLVPVLHDADRLDIEEVVSRSGEIVGRARARRVTQEDLSGGTFTVSNLGVYGIGNFTPILNPPEVAILGVGRIENVPSRANGDGIEWRRGMTLSLTVDHRAVDGVPAAQFLQTLIGHLEEPGHLFGPETLAV